MKIKDIAINIDLDELIRNVRVNGKKMVITDMIGEKHHYRLDSVLKAFIPIDPKICPHCGGSLEVGSYGYHCISKNCELYNQTFERFIMRKT